MKNANRTQILATTMSVAAALLATSLPLHAAETVKDNAADKEQVQKSTSHNPFTGTTTETVEGKRVRKHKTGYGHAQAEDHIKVERKVKDDGSKISVTREETHTEDAKAKN